MATERHSNSEKRNQLLASYINQLRCAPRTLQSKINDLVPGRVIERVRKEFYNPKVMEMVLCIVSAILTDSQSDIPRINRIKYWFRDLEQIGEPSVEGYAMSTDLKKKDNAFILKAPKRPHAVGIQHEQFVGLYGLNRIRGIVPNFAYVFGGFQCSLPVIEPGGKKRAVSYCEPLNPDDENTLTPYVIYENIVNAVTGEEFVVQGTADDFFLLLFQIAFSFRVAWLACKYTHNDFHHKNELVRELDKVYSIPYPSSQGKYYITTKYLGVTIDYGNNHIEYQGDHYGLQGFERAGTLADLPVPINDIYKFVFFTLFSFIEHGRMDIFHQVKGVIKFFHPDYTPDQDEDYISYIIKAREELYEYITLNSLQQVRDFRAYLINGTIPSSGNIYYRWRLAKEFTWDKFIDFLLGLRDYPFLSREPRAEVLACQQDISLGIQRIPSPAKRCGLEREILASFFTSSLTGITTPNDFYEFYDIYSHKEGNGTYREETRRRFNPTYPKAKRKYIQDIGNFTEVIGRKIPLLQSSRITFYTVTPQVYGGERERPFWYIEEHAQDFQQYFANVADVYHDLVELAFLIKLGMFMGDLYRDNPLLVTINAIRERGLVYLESLSRHVESLQEDAKYLQNVFRRPATIQYIGSNRNLRKRISWLRDILPRAINIFNL